MILFFKHSVNTRVLSLLAGAMDLKEDGGTLAPVPFT